MAVCLIDRLLQAVGLVDRDAQTVEEQLELRGPAVAGQRRPGVDRELAVARLHVLDAGVAAVGGVDELDARLDVLVAGWNSAVRIGCSALEPEPSSVVAPAVAGRASAGTVAPSATTVLSLGLNAVPFP